jgi:hypothetical protein
MRAGFTGDGGFVDISRVLRRDHEVFITADTPEEAQKEAHKIANRARKKGQTVTFSEPYVRDPGPVPVSLTDDPNEPRLFTMLLVREASKMAIEYVAHVAGLDVALAASLDPVRECAIAGRDPPSVMLDYIGEPSAWLPRTQRLFGFWMTDTGIPSIEQRRASAAKCADGSGELPAGVRRLTDMVHRLEVHRGSEAGVFSVILFGWIVAAVRLPAELPIRWGRFDSRDLTRRRSFTGIR